MTKTKKTIIPLLLIFTFLFPSIIFADEVTEEIDPVAESSESDIEELDSPFLTPEKYESSLAVSLAELEASGSALRITGFSSLGLPEITILPDSPLYQVKLLWEKIVLFFSFSPEKKAEVTLSGAEKRLAEAYRMIEDRQLVSTDRYVSRNIDVEGVPRHCFRYDTTLHKDSSRCTDVSTYTCKCTSTKTKALWASYHSLSKSYSGSVSTLDISCATEVRNDTTTTTNAHTVLSEHTLELFSTSLVHSLRSIGTKH